MTNSTRFSPRRFWQVLRLDLVEGTQSALKHYGSAFLAFLAFLAIPTFVVHHADHPQPEELQEMASMLGSAGFLLTLFFLLVSIGSSFASGRSSLHSRMRQLLLPASTFERFCSALLRHTVLAAVIFVLLFLCADALTATLAQIFSVPYVWSSPHFLATIANPELGDIDLPPSSAPVLFMARFIPALVYCGLWSTFLLGALLFRSKSFVLTAVILIAGFTLLSLLGALGLVSLIDHYPLLFDGQDLEHVTFISLLLFWLLTLGWMVFCIGYSYRMYARAQVIPRGRFGY